MRRLPTTSGRDLTYVGRKCSWTISDPHAPSYLKRKGIELHRRAVTTVGTTLSGSSLLSDRLLAQLQWDSLALRRWTYLFGPRLQASLKRVGGQPPMLFPGLPLTLELFRDCSEESSKTSELTIDLFKRISSLQMECGPATQQKDDRITSALPTTTWSWQFIERPALEQIILNTSTKALSTDPEKQLFPSIRQRTNRAVCRPFKDQRLAEIRGILETIHNAWSQAAAPAYSESSLLVAEEIISREVSNDSNLNIIPLLFEIESFAATETIFKRMSPLASGMYGGVWLEIGTMPLHSVTGTELCQSSRLFDELISLANGHTAPLVVNEYGCLADGNHRLTAAWIWNILSALKDETWSLDHPDFQTSVSSVIAGLNGKMSLVSQHEALHHLDVFLSDESLRANLVENLQNKHAMQPISELPVIPLLEYSTLAVIGEAYCDSKNCVRFEPGTYELFTKQHNIVLPARACYHFADRVPLPWFSIAGNETRGGLIANKHHHWSSKHADDGADVAKTGA